MTGGWLRAGVVLALLLDVVLAVALLRRNDQGSPTPGAQVDERTTTGTSTARTKPTVPLAAPSTPATDLTGHVVLPRRRYSVPAGTTLRLTGAVTPRPEDASARVVHVEVLRGHTWVRFPVPARTDRSGTFDAYVDLAGPGRYRVRLVDGDRSRSPATATVTVQ